MTDAELVAALEEAAGDCGFNTGNNSYDAEDVQRCTEARRALLRRLAELRALATPKAA